MAFPPTVGPERCHGDPRSATVTEIAVRWGFAHPGRFAGLYRVAYATTPSTTLQQRP